MQPEQPPQDHRYQQPPHPYQQPQYVVMAAPPQPPWCGFAITGFVFTLIGMLGGWCVCGIPNLIGLALGVYSWQINRRRDIRGEWMNGWSIGLGLVVGVPILVWGLLFSGSQMFSGQ